MRIPECYRYGLFLDRDSDMMHGNENARLNFASSGIADFVVTGIVDERGLALPNSGMNIYRKNKEDKTLYHERTQLNGQGHARLFLLNFINSGPLFADAHTGTKFMLPVLICEHKGDKHEDSTMLEALTQLQQYAIASMDMAFFLGEEVIVFAMAIHDVDGKILVYAMKLPSSEILRVGVSAETNYSLLIY